MTEPYTDVASHLRDELRRAWLRVEYQVRLAWTKGRGGITATDDVIGPDRDRPPVRRGARRDPGRR